MAGDPCLLYYNWSRTTWNEIDSGVIGLIAFDEMEKKGDQFLVEIMTSHGGRAIATHLWKEARGNHEGSKGET